MAQLIYSAITSLDGYVNDTSGGFEWAAPDEEVHGFVNDLERSIGTYLYGRRLYEVMLAWETMATDPGQPAVIRDFAHLWRAASKVVFHDACVRIQGSNAVRTDVRSGGRR